MLLPLNECRELFLSLGIYKAVLWLYFEHAHCVVGVNSADLCRGAAQSPSKLKMRLKFPVPACAWGPRQLLATHEKKEHKGAPDTSNSPSLSHTVSRMSYCRDGRAQKGPEQHLGLQTV